MDYARLIVVVGVVVGVGYLARRFVRPRQSDFDAIEQYATSKNLRVVSVRQSFNYWRYWASGHLLLSNVSRIFIVTTESPEGTRSDIHVAFDPLRNSEGAKILRVGQS